MTKLNIPKFENIMCNLCNPIHENTIDDGIELIKSHNILQTYEEEILDAYIQIYKTTGSVPSLALLQQSAPQFHCSTPMEIKDLLNSIRLFIKDRLNKQVSLDLISVADKISKEGVTEDVVEEISQLVKTDATTIKYENIADKIDEIYNRHLDSSGIRTGVRKIDDIIGSLKPGQLSTIAAFTGGGKSTFAVCLTHAAIKQGFNVCYLSLELSSEHLMYNLISRHSIEKDEKGYPLFQKEVVHSDMKNKTLPVGVWDYIKETILPDLLKQKGKFYILDEQDIEAYTFFAFNNKLQEIENLAIEETGHGLDLIIVDHIQMLQFSDSNSRQSENTVINKWVNYFRSQCLDFLKTKRQIHVMMCAQINRQGYIKALKHDGMYDLTALKEANEIETASSVIITLFNTEQLAAGKEIKFSVIKNRDGRKSELADTIYCDLAHVLIGGDGVTSDQEFSSMTMDDLVTASQSNIDVSNVQQSMNLVLDDDLIF